MVRFPAGPRVSLKTVDPPKGNGLGQKKSSSFSPLGLEPNHAGWTALLEESCRVKRNDTQTFSSFENVLPASPNKTFSAQTHKYPTKLPPNYSHNIKFQDMGQTTSRKCISTQRLDLCLVCLILLPPRVQAFCEFL